MIAPEPLLRAYLNVIYNVSVYVRARSRGENRLSDDQLHDLMDAIHNIPELLLKHGEFFKPEGFRKTFLADYDKRWVADDDDMSLVRALDEASNRR